MITDDHAQAWFTWPSARMELVGLMQGTQSVLLLVVPKHESFDYDVLFFLLFENIWDHIRFENLLMHAA